MACFSGIQSRCVHKRSTHRVWRRVRKQHIHNRRSASTSVGRWCNDSGWLDRTLQAREMTHQKKLQLEIILLPVHMHVDRNQICITLTFSSIPSATSSKLFWITLTKIGSSEQLSSTQNPLPDLTPMPTNQLNVGLVWTMVLPGWPLPMIDTKSMLHKFSAASTLHIYRILATFKDSTLKGPLEIDF